MDVVRHDDIRVHTIPIELNFAAFDHVAHHFGYERTFQPQRARYLRVQKFLGAPEFLSV